MAIGDCTKVCANLIKRLLEHESVIPRAFVNGGISGIYFLIRAGEIVYIGQALNVAARVATHASENTKEFDSFTYVEIPVEQMSKVERELVYLINPEYNRHLIRRTPVMDTKQVLGQLLVDMGESGMKPPVVVNNERRQTKWQRANRDRYNAKMRDYMRKKRQDAQSGS